MCPQSQEDFAASLDLHLTCTARTTQDDTESPYVLARIQGASHVPEDEEKIISCGPDAKYVVFIKPIIFTSITPCMICFDGF